jgi:hypothetical protein
LEEMENLEQKLTKLPGVDEVSFIPF